MKPFTIVAVIAAAAVLWATGALAAPTSDTLTGTVGPGFTISLTQDGTKVTKLKAGDYTLKIDDRSDQHDFHITGATVDKLTSITGMGKTT